MPESPKIINSFVSSGPAALIVNEKGAIGSHLADSLLSFGCRVYYCGSKKDDAIQHLLGKSNFELIENLNRVYEINSLSYVFYLAVEGEKLLADLLKKVKDKEAKLLLALNKKDELAQKLVREIQQQGIDIRICLYGEIYGPRLKEGFFASIIEKAIWGDKIVITKDQTENLPLVYCSDFIAAINRAMFSPDTTGRVLNIQGAFFTPLSFLAELERKIKKNLEVEFAEKPEENDGSFSAELVTDSGFGWEPEVNLGDGLLKTISWFERNKEEKGIEKTAKPIKIFTRKSSGPIKKIAFGLSLFLFLSFILFLLPIAFFWLNLSQSGKEINLALNDFGANNYQDGRDKIVLAGEKLSAGQKIFSLMAPFYSLIGLDSSLWQIEPVLNGAGDALNSARSFFEGVAILEKVFSSSIAGEPIDYSSKIKEANQILEESYLEISLAWGRLKDRLTETETAKLLRMDSYFTKSETLLLGLRKEIIRLRAIGQYLPQLIGLQGKKTYLMVLQNNLELWPTGGRIGAYAILNFNDGKLTDYEFQDVSSVDDQLRGKVEPPSGIKKYLGQENWYLKEANWEPDFSFSGERIAWFFEKETGRGIDGVIAVNYQTIKDILGLTGEIEASFLPGKVNQQNLFEKVAYYSSAGEFPGVLRKTDFFAEFGKLVMEKVKKDNYLQKTTFLKILSDSLEKKDLLLFFYDPPLASLIKSLNWDGSLLPDFPCENLVSACLKDYLSFNETNLSGNRANFFLKRNLRHDVVLKETGQFDHSLKIDYQNLSLTETWPQGRYLAYLRVFLPTGSELKSILVNDPAEPGYWVEVKKTEIEKERRADGKEMIGFLIEVPSRSGRTFEINYQPGFKADFKKTFSYLLVHQIQSGSGETTASFTFEFPAKTKPLKILPQGNLSGRKVIINDQLDRDRVFRIDFGL